jgi:hypothetical protein
MNPLTDVEEIASTVRVRRNGIFRKDYLAIRTCIAFVCMCLTVSASAKIGETVPQLVKRFGKSYTVEPAELGETYKFRSTSINVDAVVANGVSVAETYLSNHPLTASGEPPNDIVRAVLRTNVPKAQWSEIEATPFGADYALRSSDDKCIAILKYTATQPENSVWTMTVGLAKPVRALPSSASPSPNPSSSISTAAPAPSSSRTLGAKVDLVSGSGAMILVRGKVSGEIRSWLTMESRDAGAWQERGFDPYYTRLVSNYKPLARKLSNGRWELIFISEITEKIP